MKNLIYIFVLLGLVSCKKESENIDFKVVENKTIEVFKPYDKIVLLSYNQHRDAYGKNCFVKIKNNTIKISNVKIIDSIVLNEEYRNKIQTILGKTTDNKNCTMADCYNPRHILLLYNQNELKGFYEFCTECGGGYQSKGLAIPIICTEQGDKLIKVFKQMSLKNDGEESENYKYF
jgi:hypothetical protein